MPVSIDFTGRLVLVTGRSPLSARTQAPFLAMEIFPQTDRWMEMAQAVDED